MGTKMTTERSGSLYRVTWEAPAGYVWRAGRVHELVAEGRGPSAGEAQKDVKARAKLGTVPCTAPDCDWCEGL
jgi:hypothetical protein